MSSLKLDRHLETKTKEELKKDLSEELKRQKIWLVLTVVTAAVLLVAILVMVLTSLNNPLIAIIPFVLFIASFMLYAYSRQNAPQELLEDQPNRPFQGFSSWAVL